MTAKLNKLIQERYSPRAFSSKKVEKEKVHLLIEAARWAASSFNGQPARYIIGEKGDSTYSKIFESLMPKNKLWNELVPLLILTLVKTTNSYNGKPNAYAQHDLGLAMGNLSIQAMEMGLYVHQMAGFDKDLTRELFAIPEDFVPVTVIAVGYKGDLSEMPDEIQKMEHAVRTRREHDNIVFDGDWEKMF